MSETKSSDQSKNFPPVCLQCDALKERGDNDIARITELRAERDSLLALLGTERDAFGKLETEGKAEVVRIMSAERKEQARLIDERDALKAEVEKIDAKNEDLEQTVHNLQAEVESNKTVLLSYEKDRNSWADMYEEILDRNKQLVAEVERLKRDVKFFEDQYSEQVFETKKIEKLAEGLAEGVRAAQFALHHFKRYAKDIENIVGPGEWEAFRRYIRTGVQSLAAYDKAVQGEP
jgi:chromosome segregation ATPase